MQQPVVYIVILNWNGYKDTSELLESLFKITYGNYKIIVVDNNSIQEEVEKLKANYENQIQIIYSKYNLGFAGGNNVGIKYAFEKWERANRPDLILLI